MACWRLAGGVFAAILSILPPSIDGTLPPVVEVNTSTVPSTGLSSNQESRIYGGSAADVDQYPFIASLRFDPDGKTFCGGTLVAPRYILTAGHCIKTNLGQIYASLGSEFSSGAGSGSTEIIKVVEGYRHPLYNNNKHLYDVGLLKLETPSPQKTVPLCAADGSDNKVGTMATVLGWGLTEDRKGSFTLQEVNVGIISNSECNTKYRNRITEGMICAGNGNGKDSCNGDSGGPLLANGVLVGLVSWGGKCGSKAGVYTRLTYVMNYISDILSGDTDNVFTGSISQTVDTPPASPSTGSSDADEPRKPADTVASEESLSGPPTSAGSFDDGPVLHPTTVKYSSVGAEVVTTQAPAAGSTTDATKKAPTSDKSCISRKQRLLETKT